MDHLALAREATTTEKNYASEALVQIRALVVVDDPGRDFAAEILRDVKARFKTIDDKRKTITVPLNEAKKQVDALFKPVLDDLAESERELKNKIARYLAACEEANRKALAAAAAATTPAQAELALATVTEARAPEGVSIRYQWKFEVTDPMQVPVAYLSPDPQKIGEAARAAVDAGGEPPSIPGVRFFKEPVVTARRSP